MNYRNLRCQRTHLTQWRRQLDSLARILDSVSYRGVLARGFALVRGADGQLRRRADALKPGEELTLVFGDGEAQAVAAGMAAPRPRGKKPGTDQGSLF